MKRHLLLAMAMALVGACASTPVVHTDHDPAATFSAYRTYAWRQEPPASNPLVRQRLVEAIEARLLARGWSPAPESEADIALVGNVASREEQTIETFYDGPGWGEWEWRGVAGRTGARTTHVYTYTVGTLVLDMFDNRTKKAVWRATAEGTVPATPKQVDAALQAAVDKMFAEFPPAP